MATDLITLSQPRAAAADAYRTLRTNLLFSNLDTPLRTVGITSPAEDNQKSIAAANLAVTFAQNERRTLLVEADLRRPSIHQYFDVVNSKSGLTTMLLAGSQDTDDTLIVQTPVDGLSVLAAGEVPSNPVDVLASERMGSMVQGLMNNFDIIVFHLAPVLVGADALVLGQRLDGVVLITQAGKTRRNQTVQAKEQLERVNVQLLGAVLMDAEPDRAASQYR